MSTLTQPKVRKHYAYKWKAVNRQGQETSGELDASSLDELKVILMSRGFSRIEAKKVSQSVFAKL
ncbi:MAG: hypothetical protein ACRC8I_02820, partial [Plesiomonas shigelloides]